MSKFQNHEKAISYPKVIFMRRNLPSNRDKIQGLYAPQNTTLGFAILRVKVELAGDNRRK